MSGHPKLCGALFLLMVSNVDQTRGAESYVEPGSLRLSHELLLEGVTHRLQNGWHLSKNGLNNRYSHEGNEDQPWRGESGQRLLTDVAARITPDIFGRTLFELQGDYADRFWRPINANHRAHEKGQNFIFRQAEGRIDKDAWYLHGFAGVGHADWRDQGDFFGLYPASYPDSDYLGASSLFGIYPDRWKEDLFLNISDRHAPRGAELGGEWLGVNGAAAFGDELSWGYRNSYYARASLPLRSSSLAAVHKNQDVPYAFNPSQDERDRAYSLAWKLPFEEGHKIEAGILYQPFRVGKRYKVARDAAGGGGLLGSSFNISEKTSKKEDALAERVRIERHSARWDRLWIWHVDITHADILAGNKEELNLGVGTDITSSVRMNTQYVYRRPVEGPIPFLYEGSPTNIGAVAANPRGPESPFTVNWSNREAVFFTATASFDPTPGTPMFLYDPNVLANWNVNPKESSDFCLAVQYRASDYRSTTDRQYYYDERGDIVWEPAAHSGAWASEDPLHEFRLLGLGRSSGLTWMLGLAGGQSPALSSLAYSTDPSQNKPVSEYVSVEGKIERWPWAGWAHFGSGIWGPEPFQYFFGESFDRLWGVGVSYNISPSTTWDIDYIAARQADELFVAPDLGSYDEIRTVLSHRFGFVVEFSEAPRGYRAR